MEDYTNQEELKIRQEDEYSQGYLDGWGEGRNYQEGDTYYTPRWRQEDIKPDDVRKHYAQGYVNGYGDGIAGVPCHPAGEREEGRQYEQFKYSGPEF